MIGVAAIIIFVAVLVWYAFRFWAWLRTIFTGLVILVAMSLHAQPFNKMTGTGAYGGLVTYSPAAQKWDQRTALQWWNLTPSYFRSAVRDSVFALSGDTAALVLGLDPYGQGTPVTIGSGLNLSAGVLTSTGGVSGTGINRYLALWTGATTIDTADIYVDANGDLTAPGDIYANGGTIVLTSEVDGDPANEIQAVDSLYVTGTTLYASLSSDGVAAKSVDLAVIQDGTGTDDQAISIDSVGRVFTVTLEDGGAVTFQDTNTDADADPANEIQTVDSLYLVGTTLHASLSSDAVPTKTVDLSSIQDGTGTDNQELATSGSNGENLNISGANGIGTITTLTNVLVPSNGSSGQVLTKGAGATYAWDALPADNDGQTLSWNGGTGEITISGGNTIDIDGRYLESEVDGSTTNELQQLDTFGIFGNVLYASLSSDGVPAKTASLAPYLDNTDAQTLSFSNPNLSISGGNSVDISALVPAYKSGHTSGTTTGGGNLAVTHSFPGGTPTVVLVTLGNTTPAGVTVRVISITSTTFGLHFYNTGTAASLASTAVDVYWRVE